CLNAPSQEEYTAGSVQQAAPEMVQHREQSSALSLWYRRLRDIAGTRRCGLQEPVGVRQNPLRRCSPRDGPALLCKLASPWFLPHRPAVPVMTFAMFRSRLTESIILVGRRRGSSK